MCDPGYVKWMKDAFDMCVVTNKELWSFWMSMISNVLWIVSAIPQIVKYCRTGDVTGVSPFFFTLIMIGDLFSVVGCFLSGGLITLAITYILYTVLDGTCVVQYFYYTIKNKLKNKNSNDNDDDLEELKEIDMNGPDPGTLAVIPAVAMAAASEVDFAAVYSGTELIGTIMGWIGSCIFIASRLPQLISNQKNKDPGGLTPIFFVITIFANGTTVISILLRSIEPQFLWDQLPFAIGAAIPMICDITMLIQFFAFGGLRRMKDNKATEEVEEEDSEERADPQEL